MERLDGGKVICSARERALRPSHQLTPRPPTLPSMHRLQVSRALQTAVPLRGNHAGRSGVRKSTPSKSKTAMRVAVAARLHTARFIPSLLQCACCWTWRWPFGTAHRTRGGGGEPALGTRAAGSSCRGRPACRRQFGHAWASKAKSEANRWQRQHVCTPAMLAVPCRTHQFASLPACPGSAPETPARSPYRPHPPQRQPILRGAACVAALCARGGLPVPLQALSFTAAGRGGGVKLCEVCGSLCPRTRPTNQLSGPAAACRSQR